MKFIKKIQLKKKKTKNEKKKKSRMDWSIFDIFFLKIRLIFQNKYLIGGGGNALKREGKFCIVLYNIDEAWEGI